VFWFAGKYLYASERIYSGKAAKSTKSTPVEPTALDDLESLYYVCVVWATQGDSEWLRTSTSPRQLEIRKMYWGSGRYSLEVEEPWGTFLKGIRTALFHVANPSLAGVRAAFARAGAESE
jgi:hypothetical protein